MKKEVSRTSYTVPGMYTVNDAAEMLGVSNPRVLQLIYAAELTAQRTVGDAYLIHAESLQSYQRIRQGNGRPWKADVAWAALWMLSDMEIGWLAYPQHRRLLQRLKRVNADNLVWLTRRRASVKRVRVSTSLFNNLKEEMVLSGASSEFIRTLGLTQRNDIIEGYVAVNTINKIKEKYHFVEENNTNAILHLVDESCFKIADREQMPEAVALVDLAASADTRERRAALSRLEELLHEKG
ncbi:MAG: helix-turn-helix domain-containing protein [Coriobacteriales bacterium]|jgi:excisionase family DNA binding protein|nr:helix-turn-helix domain-containing protein [Coriobacteriales bacterium]